MIFTFEDVVVVREHLFNITNIISSYILITCHIAISWQAPTDMSMLHEGDEETAELEEEQERKLQEMDEDLEKQKEAQLKSGASEAETQAALAALQRQYEAKRKVLPHVCCVVIHRIHKAWSEHGVEAF